MAIEFQGLTFQFDGSYGQVISGSYGQVISAFDLIADPIKATSAEALAALREAGVQVVMLTGDNAVTARAVAKRLGIDAARPASVDRLLWTGIDWKWS